MNREFIKFPKIGQFRQMVKDITEKSALAGLDDEGNAIKDYSIKKPTIKFKGTVKIHGTNAGVNFNPLNSDVYAQSRNNIITPEKDNAGFAFFVENNKEVLKEISSEYVNDDNEIVTLFGEWCGGNIQKGIAINGLPKMFVIFSVLVGDKWFEVKEFSHDNSLIFNINQFPTFEIDIDFNHPEMSVPELQKITEEVEKVCPVGKAFGVEGIGEGVVWSDKAGGMFKVKGDKHSSSKVKKLANVDIDKINTINEFVEYAVTENRLNQGIEQTFKMNNIDIDFTGLGDLIRWVINDIISEESDTLFENNLEPKDIGKDISTKVRDWFKNEFI